MADNTTQENSSTSSDDVRDIEHQVDFIYEQWTQYADDNNRFVIITAGKSGVGKSTLLNNFLELEGDAAFEARLDPTSVTTRVDYRDREINGVQIRVIDMPGLHATDTEERTQEILGNLTGVIEEGIDVVFFCINLLHRLDRIDYENMKTLSEAFGPEIWQHVIFVFTHTDLVLYNGSSAEELVEKFTKQLQTHLVQNLQVNVEVRPIHSFPIYSVSRDAEINRFKGIVGILVSKVTRIPESWRITLLLQVIRICREKNVKVLLRHFARSTAIVAASGVGGAAAGITVGTAIGAIVGGVLTAPIGGVGAVPTAAGGAALGAWIGTLGGSSASAFTALILRIVQAIYSRQRSRSQIRERIQREKRITQESTVTNQDPA